MKGIRYHVGLVGHLHVILSQSNARISRIQVRVCTVRRLVAFGYDVPFEDRSDSALGYVSFKDWLHSGVCRSKIGCIRVCAVLRLVAFSHASFEDRWVAYPTTSRTSSLRYCVRREIEKISKSFLPHNGSRSSFLTK